jgi:hypothetical protein
MCHTQISVDLPRFVPFLVSLIGDTFAPIIKPLAKIMSMLNNERRMPGIVCTDSAQITEGLTRLNEHQFNIFL